MSGRAGVLAIGDRQFLFAGGLVVPVDGIKSIDLRSVLRYGSGPGTIEVEGVKYPVCGEDARALCTFLLGEK